MQRFFLLLLLLLTSTITVPSLAQQDSITCPGFQPSRLTPGGIGRVLPGDPNRVRSEPSTDGDIIWQLPGGASFVVVEGPECGSGGIAWWRIDYDGRRGWTAEGVGNNYFIEPISEAYSVDDLPSFHVLNPPDDIATINLQAITVENADQVVEIGQVGVGRPGRVRWSVDGMYIYAITANGLYRYMADDLSIAPMQLTDGSDIEQFGMSLALNPSDGSSLIAGDPLLVVDSAGNLVENRVQVTTREVGISADGQTAVLARGDTVTIYDWETGDQITETVLQTGIDGVYSSVTEIDISDDGRLIALASTDQNVWLFTRDGGLIGLLPNFLNVSSTDISPDGRLVVSGDGDSKVRLWSASSLSQLVLWQHELRVNSVRFSPDGTLVASTSDDGTAVIWRISDGAKVTTLNHSADVLSADFSPDGQKLVTVAYDGLLRVWELDQNSDQFGSVLESSTGLFEGINGLAVLPDERILIDTRSASKVAISPDQTRVARASSVLLDIWDITSEELERTLFRPSENFLYGMAYAPDGSTVATIDSEEIAQVTNTTTGTIIQSRTFPNERLLSDIEYFFDNPDELHIVSYDSEIIIWNLADDEVSSFEYLENILELAFSQDKYTGAAGNGSGQIIIEGANIPELERESRSGVTDLKFSQDHSLLLVSLQNNTVEIWDTEGGERLAILEGHANDVNQVWINEDMTIVYSASEDGTVRMWSIPG